MSDEKTQKLTLVESGLTKQQLLHILQKTPRQHIYRRPAKGSGEWDYVTGTYVKKVLNYVFGWDWDFTVKDHGREGNQVWVLGKLIVRIGGLQGITKEQFGRADIKFKKGTEIPLDYGNDLKAATTDALKKCAAELGIASDIYGKNEFREIKIQETRELPTPQGKNAKVQDKSSLVEKKENLELSNVEPVGVIENIAETRAKLRERVEESRKKAKENGQS